MLKITLKHGGNFLSATQVSLCDKDLQQLLRSKGEKEPEPGSIVDRGTKGKYRIFIYKFNNTTRCSNASEDDFHLSMSEDDLIQPPIKIKRNVAWAFYCLKREKTLILRIIL